MRVFKLILCLLSFLLYFFCAFILSLWFIFRKPSDKSRVVSGLIRLFDLCLVRIINIKVRVIRENATPAKNGGGVFFASNHLGYVDGFLLGSLFPVIYVGKAELKNWPLIGLMTEFSGTLYIDRQKKNHIAEYIDAIARVLQAGGNVLFFPEGTSTNGEGLLPFKSAFFEAPLKSGSPIVPVSIVYKAVDGRPLTKENRDLVYWYGDMTFADHFFRLLSCRCVEAEVTVHRPLVFEDAQDKTSLRKHACEMTYEAIAKDIALISQ